jgi:hypothetical protein
MYFHTVNYLLEDKTSHMHIELCLKITKMHPNGSANSLETQVLQTNIEIMPIHAPPHLTSHASSSNTHWTHHSCRHFGGWCMNSRYMFNITWLQQKNHIQSTTKKWENLINSLNCSSMGTIHEIPNITSKSQSNSKLWATWLIVLASWCIFKTK